MKSLSTNLVHFSAKINIRVVLFVVTLLMFVLAAGAPMCAGGVGG